MSIDGAEFWVYIGANEKDPYSDNKQRVVCYVDRGARHSSGNWPKGGDPFYNSPCYGDL